MSYSISMDLKEKKHSGLTLSSAEAKCVSAAYAIQKLYCLINQLDDLNMPQQLSVKLLEDNQSCIKMIQQPKYIPGTKHIGIKHHVIGIASKEGIIELIYQLSLDIIPW